MKLGEKIQQLRKSNGMSQEQLAEKILISRQAISKWELGESIPDADNLLQLSKLFGVSVDYLLNEDYNSDNDIPAVKENSVVIQNEYIVRTAKKLTIAAWIFTGIGLLGILTIFILSSVIPSIDFESHAPNPKNSQQEQSFISPVETIENNSEEVTVDSPVRAYDFGAFITRFHLETIFGLCCVSLLIGVSLFIVKKKKYYHAIDLK